jgi:hypothetical protein
MKNKKTVLIGGLLVMLLVVAVVGATSAYAQSSSDTLLHGRGPGGGRGPPGGAGLEAAAEALGMTTDELTAALQSGKTLEQIAEDAGVAFEDVQAAIQAARAEEMRSRIQQAVDDGTITQEHAGWLLEGLDKGFIGGPDGFGFGGPHGHGFGPAPEQAPTVEPTQQSGG